MASKTAKLTDVETRVRNVLVEHLGVDEKEVTLNADLREDLSADSLDHVEVMMALEEEFNLDAISDAEAEKIKTVGDIVDYVTKNA